MDNLVFSNERARALADFYSKPDLVAQRAATMDKLAIAAGEAVIDIGSGPGFLSETLAAAAGPHGSVLGIDISEDLIAFSRTHAKSDWLSFQQADATALPLQADCFDVATCTQVVEYIPDTKRVLSEIFRVLKPNGRAIVIATDWDTVAWHSEHPERMAHVLKAWEGHCAHPRLPRTLGPLLLAAGFQVTEISMYPLVNTSYHSDVYSYGASKLIHDYTVNSGLVPQSTGDAWLRELSSLDAAGQYYFTSSRMFFSARKPD